MLDIGMQSRALAAIAIPPVRQDDRPGDLEALPAPAAAADAEIYDEIARRRQATDIEDRDDVLSILLQAHDEDGRPMTDQELRDELMTLLVAGHETTATTLAWAFDLLLRHPAELERLTAEVEAGEDDEYLDAVIKETLRIRPVVPGVVRVLTAPIELNGYELPAGDARGTEHLPHAPAPGRVSRAGAVPPRAVPRRRADTYSWIPFGGGIRRCLGASFALYEMKIVIPAILRGVRLRPRSPSRSAIRAARDHVRARARRAGRVERPRARRRGARPSPRRRATAFV